MNKNLNLSFAILAFIVFLGYLGETGPIEILGLEMNIWVLRLLWLFVAMVQLLSYIRKLKEKE